MPGCSPTCQAAAQATLLRRHLGAREQRALQRLSEHLVIVNILQEVACLACVHTGSQQVASHMAPLSRLSCASGRPRPSPRSGRAPPWGLSVPGGPRAGALPSPRGVPRSHRPPCSDARAGESPRLRVLLERRHHLQRRRERPVGRWLAARGELTRRVGSGIIRRASIRPGSGWGWARHWRSTSCATCERASSSSS